MEPRELFENHLGLIDEVCSSICHRNGCFPPDSEDFTSQVRIELMADDYARLRKFSGRSRFKTFLTTVVLNLFRDYRNSKWGKWRPSAAARREGPLAIKLDELLTRDGYTLDEAVQVLRVTLKVEETEAEIRRLAEMLPVRRARPEDDESAVHRLVGGKLADAGVEEAEKAELARKAQDALERALAAQDPVDRMVLKMRHEQGFTATRIADALKLDRRKLYRRIERCYRSLRTFIEAEGLQARDILSLEGWIE